MNTKLTLRLLSLMACLLLGLISSAESIYSCSSTISFNTAPIRNLNVGDTSDWIYITLTRNDNIDHFTNFQFVLGMPDGLEVAGVSAANTDVYGSLSISSAFNPNFGGYLILGVNVTSDGDQIQITKNPLTICRIKVKKTGVLPQDASILVTHLKYTANIDDSWVAEDQIIDLGIGNPIYGDVNYNGIVDIADVNAVINVMLGKGGVAATDADVNYDGSVDIFDVNEVINAMLGITSPLLLTFTVNGVSFNMVNVEGGTFTMGATIEQGNQVHDDENPTHEVTLSTYRIGETEVTQELWLAVMGINPSNFTGELQHPVENVSWDDCKTFINRLNQLTGKNFRLPSEAEWEYAARGGNRSQGYRYAGSNYINDVAWYYDNSSALGNSNPNYGTHSVATKAPNELGLFDMCGNVLEWCQDWYGSYTSQAQNNPIGPISGAYRVCRGGSWLDSEVGCRVSFRNYYYPGQIYAWLGLRLAL